MTQESAPVDSDDVLLRLKHSEELYARAFMSNPVPMTITNGQTHRFSHVNHAFSLAFGYTRAEMLGRTSEELQLWPARAQRDSVAERISLDDAMPLTEGTVRDKSGASVCVLASFRLLQFGGVPAVLSVLVPVPVPPIPE